jgi:Reverse transcriptase (RNA-dependent DNA polymerase)
MDLNAIDTVLVSVEQLACQDFCLCTGLFASTKQSRFIHRNTQRLRIKGNQDEWALKVLNNIYGQKEAGNVWYKYLPTKLIVKIQFQQSKYNPCVLCKNGCILIVYTNDTIITGPSGDSIDEIISDADKLFNITSEDNIHNFLGINIDKQSDGMIVMTQPKLIQEIIDDLGLQENLVSKETPALPSTITTNAGFTKF